MLTPRLEFLNIEHVVANDVHVDVQRSHVVAVLQAQRHKGVGVLDAINEVASALNHALVYEFAEWFFLHAIAVVLKEFVPESAVDEVTGCVLGAADIEVDILPILVGFL